jgi:hypothetical protein
METTMTAGDQLFGSDIVAAGGSTDALPEWIRSIGRRLVAWAETCADYYAAAATYEQLSALSDAESARRGLSRATLARDLCAASK